MAAFESEELVVLFEAVHIRIGSLESEIQFCKENMSNSRTDSDCDMWLQMSRDRGQQVVSLKRVLAKLEARDV